jgi:hypothetical protein
MPRTDRLLTAAVAPLWAASALGWAVTVAVSQPLAWRRPVRTGARAGRGTATGRGAPRGVLRRTPPQDRR